MSKFAEQAALAEPMPDPTEPSAGGELAKALAAAQAEMTNPKQDAVNPHFRNHYTSLPALLDAVRPVLAKHGIALSAPTDIVGDTVVLRTRLMHESGETLESVYPLRPTKQDPQGFGSAMTYALRYTIAALVGVAGAPDDDGEQASAPAPKRQQKAKPEGKPTRTPWRRSGKGGRCEDCSQGFGPEEGYYRYDGDVCHMLCLPCADRRKREADQAEAEMGG